MQAVALKATQSCHEEKLVIVLRVKGGRAVIAGFAPGK
jgi:hypothetical protein